MRRGHRNSTALSAGVALAVWLAAPGPGHADPDRGLVRLDLGLLAGYTWIATGQVTRMGPMLGVTRDVGPLTLRGEYAYLFWEDEQGTAADGREHHAALAVQLDLTRQRAADRRWRAYIEGGAAAQLLSLGTSRQLDSTLFVGVGLDMRFRVVTVSWPRFYGPLWGIRLARGPAILPPGGGCGDAGGACAQARQRGPGPAPGPEPAPRGHDWSMLFFISNGFSW